MRGTGGSTATAALPSLDDPACLLPSMAGAKGAWLARGRAAGLPVLDGVVVPADWSTPHLDLGAEAVTRRGSGGARLEVSGTPLAPSRARAVVDASARLGQRLVVRSSSVLEGGAEWAGAFTSYLDITPDQTPKAVTGCWASAFGVSTLDRHAAAGIPPQSAPMAVVIQPHLSPDAGGTARLEGDTVVIVAVEGSPAPLVQGWEPGLAAVAGPDGSMEGAALGLLGSGLVERVAAVLREAQRTTGATVCEWASTDQAVHLLQLASPPSTPASARSPSIPVVHHPDAPRLARLVSRHPGPLGEALVLPWATGHPSGRLDEPGPIDVEPERAWEEAGRIATSLTTEAWELPPHEAREAARRSLSELRGPDPGPALARLARLVQPDRDTARRVLSLLATVRSALAQRGAVTWPESAWYLEPEQVATGLAGGPGKRDRFGFDRWEPFLAAVTVGVGGSAAGVAAAPGLGAGRMCWMVGGDLGVFRPRDVIVAPRPTPDLAPLLWDAAALVTLGGGPGAHLFESARALAIPAVCGVRLEEVVGADPVTGSHVLAVDGETGTVHALPR